MAYFICGMAINVKGYEMFRGLIRDYRSLTASSGAFIIDLSLSIFLSSHLREIQNHWYVKRNESNFFDSCSPVIFASIAVKEKDEQADYLLRRKHRHSQTGFSIAVKIILQCTYLLFNPLSVQSSICKIFRLLKM